MKHLEIESLRESQGKVKRELLEGCSTLHGVGCIGHAQEVGHVAVSNPRQIWLVSLLMHTRCLKDVKDVMVAKLEDVLSRSSWKKRRRV